MFKHGNEREVMITNVFFLVTGDFCKADTLPHSLVAEH